MGQNTEKSAKTNHAATGPKKGGKVATKKGVILNAAEDEKPVLALGEKAVGTVKFFKASGWGFIEGPDFADVFVHKTGIPPELEQRMEPGASFNFTVVTSDRDERPMARITSLAEEQKEAA